MITYRIGTFEISSDLLIRPRYENKILFVSLVGHSSVINAINSMIKKGTELKSYNTYVFMDKHNYVFQKYKEDKNGLVHEIISFENKDFNFDKEEFCFDLFYTDEENKKDQIYNILDQYTNIPLIPEWKDFLYNKLRLAYISNNEVSYDRQIYEQAPILSCRLQCKKSTVFDIISNGLKDHEINICNSETSDTINNIVGLDNYLNTFSDVLTNKIKSSFVPQFSPGENTFTQRVNDFDDACYDSGTKLFYAQKCTIQSVVNALKNKKSNFIIGEQGSGKTLMSLGVCYGFAKKDGFNCFIMCPAHLVNKWEREINKYVPNGKAYIVKNISDIISIDHILRDKHKVENTFVIVSKENAKLDMEYRPTAVWSNVHKAYICPNCGNILYAPMTQAQKRNYQREKLTDADFRKPLENNKKCLSQIEKWNNIEEKADYVYCDTHLWVPVGENNDGWIKLGSAGWFHKDRIRAQYDELVEKQNKTKQECSVLSVLSDYINKTDTFRQPTYSRYPLAKYIHKFYKGYVDYAIGDELHLYNGDSAQGEAFGYFADVANKTLGLTGTLLNGYADGLFYTLFRTMPDVLKNEGFSYKMKDSFSNAFGVVKNVYTEYTNQSSFYNTRRTSITKKLPGVSPLVFTKFLLENAVFVNLSDMLDGLPNYTEIPIGIDIDEDLRNKYTKLQDDFIEQIRRNHKGFSIAGSMTKTLSAYLDMPYDIDPVCDPKTGAVLVTPENVIDTEMVRAKEQRLIDIIKEKNANGEKVLVYYHWTNITNIDERIPALLRKEGFNVAVMKSNVSAQKREEWIKQKVEKENIDVLMCNPSLVETGLDLLDFTTIVFYEVGYNLYTMRQSSRRSWRLGQTRPISVYYLYYNDTIQEQALSLMATKLQASLAIEGKFSEEGLNALSNNEDLLTQIANSIVSGIKHKVSSSCFATINTEAYHNEDHDMNIFQDIFDDLDDLDDNMENDKSNEIIQHIISEPKRYFRRTKYQIEGKNYKHEYWKNSIRSLGTILSKTNVNNQLCDIFIGAL